MALTSYAWLGVWGSWPAPTSKPAISLSTYSLPCRWVLQTNGDEREPRVPALREPANWLGRQGRGWKSWKLAQRLTPAGGNGGIPGLTACLSSHLLSIPSSAILKCSFCAQDFLSPLCVCVWDVCVFVHTCMWRSAVDLEYLSQSLSLNLELICLAGLVG